MHLLLSIATKVGKNAFCLPKQKALINARLVFSNTPADGSSKILFYHPQTINAFLLLNSFTLPSAWISKRSQIHVGSLEGSNSSPSKCKRFTISHIFSLADVCGCRKASLLWLSSLKLLLLCLIQLSRRQL